MGKAALGSDKGLPQTVRVLEGRSLVGGFTQTQSRAQSKACFQAFLVSHDTASAVAPKAHFSLASGTPGRDQSVEIGARTRHLAVYPCITMVLRRLCRDIP